MAIYTKEIATEFNFPNITIYRVFKDGALTRWEAKPNEGYVIYDPNEDTGEETYYGTTAGFPKAYDFANFTYVAVLQSEIQ